MQDIYVPKSGTRERCQRFRILTWIVWNLNQGGRKRYVSEIISTKASAHLINVLLPLNIRKMSKNDLTIVRTFPGVFGLTTGGCDRHHSRYEQLFTLWAS